MYVTAPVSIFLLSPQSVWLGFGFNVIAMHPWFVISYDLFGQILILLNRRNRFPFISVFCFGEKKVIEAWLRFCFFLCQKLTHKHRCVNWCIIMLQNLWLVSPQFCAFLTNCFRQSAHNFKVVFFTERTTMWEEFMIHRAIASEENSEQNLHIWLNLTCFCRS